MRTLSVIALSTAALASTTGYALEPPRPEPPLVYVSIAPQAWFVEELFGDSVTVRVLLPAASGHVNYSPTPSQIRDLDRARVFVRSELPFEARIWERLRAVNPEMRVVPSTVSGFGGAMRAALLGHGHAHEHDSSADPHFWLDPLQMIAQARAVCDIVRPMVREDRDLIQNRMKNLAARLRALNTSIDETLKAAGRTSFWTFHGSWGHFAQRYGLTQHAIEFEGKETGLRTMIEIVAELRQSGAGFILVEPGLDPQRLDALESETALTFIRVDPMRRDYETNMKRMADAIAAGK